MGILGDMIVRIKGDTSQLVSSLQQTDKSVKRFAQVIMGGAAIGGVIMIFRQLGRTVGEVIKLINEQQEAEGRLSSAIRATGREASISVMAIADLADELQKTTVYSDEATLSAAAMLQQLGNLDEQGLKRLIPRVQDFAAAMGLDLVDAAKIVGKTLGTSTNALGRYGVEIAKGAEGSARMEAVIAGLEGKFSGMAETIGKTTVGSLKILQNQFDELRQNLATVFAPIISKVTKELNGVLTTWSNMGKIKEAMNLQWAISTFENATSAIQTLEKAIREETEYYNSIGIEVDKKKIAKWQEQVTMIRQVIPLLETQAAATAKAVPPTKALAEETEKVALATFNARTEYDMMLRALGEEIPRATANARNEFGMLGRQTEELREQFEFTFGAEELRNFEEASKKLSAQFAVAEQEMTSTLMTEAEARKAIRQAEWDLVSSLIQAIGAISDNYYKGLLDNENLTDKEKKKIMRQQAQAQKTAGIFAAIINTAEAITKALSSAAPPFNFILAALSAAAGGLQIAAIASQPLPKLAKGGKLVRPTMFMGGEAGPEWVVPELKLDELGGRIAESMRDARISNTIINDQPIQLSVNLGGRELEAYIQQAISNRRILVREGSVAR